MTSGVTSTIEGDALCAWDIAFGGSCGLILRNPEGSFRTETNTCSSGRMTTASSRWSNDTRPAELSVALQLVERPAERPAGGICAIIFVGDPLGFLNNATGGPDHILPCVGIGRDPSCNVAGDLAQQH